MAVDSLTSQISASTNNQAEQWLQPRINGQQSGSASIPQAWWLHPEAFLQPDFDADAYIADLRKTVPLETLSTELNAHLSSLKLKLVEVVNADYADFVSLSTQLVNVDGAVGRMQTPLTGLQEKLAGMSQSVADEIAALEQGLQRRAAVSQLRATLELMQDAAHVMPKVEKLLGEADAAAPGADLETRVRLYERISSEVSRLQFYIAQGSDIPFIQRLEPRLEQARQALQARLAEALEAALECGNDAVVSVLLQSYTAIGDAQGAEAVIRRQVMKPLVQQAIQGALANSGPNSDTLPQALSDIKSAVSSRLEGLLSAASASASGLHAFDFLGSCLMPEVDQAVAESLPGCFSPGIPSAFVINYRAASDFLSSLEGAHVRSSTALSAFRAASATQQFLRRWNLPVYFSLRFQEIASALDTAATRDGLQQLTAEQRLAAPDVKLQVTGALTTALLKTVASDVFLRPLADKFARLALQLVARYASWLRLGLEDNSSNSGGNDSGAAPEEKAKTLQGRQWEAAEDMALVWSDARTASTWLLDSYCQLLLDTLSFLPEQASDRVAAAWDEAVSSLHAASAPLGPAIVEAVAAKCTLAMKPMRSTVTTYRMVARPMPTRPSPYVPSILQPLRGFLDHDNAVRLSDSQRQSLSTDVIAAVCQRFQTTAGGLVDSERKTESSLKRLNRSRAGEAPAEAASSGVNSTDKMAAQLFLDVQELGRQVFKFDMDPREMAAFKELWASLAPAGQEDVDAALLLG